MKKLTTEEFTYKANLVHKNKYNYLNTEYHKGDEKVTITCPEHGEFKQRADSHLSGNGCRKCNNKKLSETKSLSLDTFIKRSTKIHNNFYSYSKTVYVNNQKKVTITCPTHGDFEQSPSHHLKGKGCKQCAITHQTTTKEEFVIKSDKVHKNYYSYNNTTFSTLSDNISITCPLHGEFQQRAFTHLNGGRCPECRKLVKRISLSHKDKFELKARKAHAGKYDYSKVNYVNNKTKVVITCPEHGDFQQSPQCHTNKKQGCPLCGNRRKVNTWGYSDWEKAGLKSKNFTGFKLYVIECWDQNEKFIKIGKTYTDISKRFSSGTLPYDWRILHLIEGSANYISSAENKLHSSLKPYKYLPITSFGGVTECFTTNSLSESCFNFFQQAAA